LIFPKIMQGGSKRTRVHSASWLNIRYVLPGRDVRVYLFSFLDVLDRAMIRFAHGVTTNEDYKIKLAELAAGRPDRFDLFVWLSNRYPTLVRQRSDCLCMAVRGGSLAAYQHCRKELGMIEHCQAGLFYAALESGNQAMMDFIFTQIGGTGDARTDIVHESAVRGGKSAIEWLIQNHPNLLGMTHHVVHLGSLELLKWWIKSDTFLKSSRAPAAKRILSNNAVYWGRLDVLNFAIDTYGTFDIDEAGHFHNLLVTVVQNDSDTCLDTLFAQPASRNVDLTSFQRMASSYHADSILRWIRIRKEFEESKGAL